MFKKFSQAVAKQIETMRADEWLETDIPKDELWKIYISSFPEGTNPIYKERTEHDCNCCKNFIRDIGGLVSLKSDSSVSTIWDVNVGEFYQVVADAMAKRVRESNIKCVFTHWSKKVGAEKSLQQLPDNLIKQWNHFYGEIPNKMINISPANIGECNATVSVFKRGLEEVTNDAIDSALELIDQNSIYRGQEFRSTIASFKQLKKDYDYLNNEKAKNMFLWLNYGNHGARIRNTAIGTLLTDLSTDVDIDSAVKSFEAKVAPTNYKRPAPLITKKMVEQAITTIKEDNLEDSIRRRYATIEDISVNDILFADRSVKPAMKSGLESSLLEEIKDKPKDFSQVKEIHINEFIENVLPSVSSIEIYVENSHEPNLVSLIAPLHQNSANLFKWSNPFSWSYNGNVTDSIKEKVKSAGGKVDGFLRVSLSWFNYDDLDLHVREPSGYEIYYGNKRSGNTLGNLDVDMNAGTSTTRSPVENICWPDKRKMVSGIYVVSVQNFRKQESIDVGFVIEIECGNNLYNFKYTKPLQNKESVEVANIHFDGGILIQKINPHVEIGTISKNIWGLNTGNFHKVSLVTLSPNHWHGSEDGNKHYIFVLDGCKNPEKARGFYNEFLPAKYNKYRKVFEVLGDKTKCEYSDKQLSGLGFSSTKENSIVCKVSGKVNRMLKVIF